MVWRMLMRYFANNEQVIERLSQSAFMRRAAQLTVYFTLRWKAVGEKSLNDLLRSNLMKEIENSARSPTTKLKSFGETFSSELRSGMKNMQDSLKKK